MSQERLDPELTSLAERLARLQPAPADLPRDRLMYLAGRAAGARARGWRSALGGALLLVLGLAGGVGLDRLAPRELMIFERIVEVVGDKADLPAPPAEQSDDPPIVPVAEAPPWRQALIDTALAPPAFPATGEDARPTWSLEELLDLPAGSIGPNERRRWEKALSPGDRS